MALLFYSHTCAQAEHAVLDLLIGNIKGGAFRDNGISAHEKSIKEFKAACHKPLQVTHGLVACRKAIHEKLDTMVFGVGDVLVSPSSEAKGTAPCSTDEKTKHVEELLPHMIAGGILRRVSYVTSNMQRPFPLSRRLFPMCVMCWYNSFTRFRIPPQ
jgi:hypothetical protein